MNIKEINKFLLEISSPLGLFIVGGVHDLPVSHVQSI